MSDIALVNGDISASSFGDILIVDDDADVVGFKNRGHNDADGFTGAGRRQNQNGQRFGQPQQFAVPTA